MQQDDQEQPGLTVDEVLRRAHAEYVSLSEQLELAREREAVAQADLAEARRQADDVLAPTRPRVARAVEVLLREADDEAAAVLAAADARVLEITAETRRVFLEVVSKVREALDDALSQESPGASPVADDDWFAELWEGRPGS